jgi:AcrR family transcriptional regulator
MGENDRVTAVGAVPLRSDARRTRDRLLDAAVALLEAGGAHFTLPDVARQAGVGTATVYRHFPDVAELLTAVEVRSITALTAAIDELEPDDDPRRRFGAICERWIDRSIRDSAALRFLRSPEGVLERAGRGDPVVIGLLRSLEQAITDLVTAAVVPAQDVTAGALVWITLFDERIVIDLGRTAGWTTHHLTQYLGGAVLGALGGR